MYELMKAELDKVGAFTPGLNKHVQSIINAIPYSTVDQRMKTVIAVTQLIAFASQFRRNIIIK